MENVNCNNVNGGFTMYIIHTHTHTHLSHFIESKLLSEGALAPDILSCSYFFFNPRSSSFYTYVFKFYYGKLHFIKKSVFQRH